MRRIAALNRRLASLSIADLSPGLVLRRVVALFSRGDHREAAALLRRVPPDTHRALAPSLPMERFLRAMPHSIPVLEAVYARAFASGVRGLSWDERFSPESVVWHLVRFFAAQTNGSGGQQQQQQETPSASAGRIEMCGPWVSTCKRLLAVLMAAEPR